MTRFECDVCHKEITDVVYVIKAMGAARPNPVVSESHLHWRCIPDYAKG